MKRYLAILMISGIALVPMNLGNALAAGSAWGPTTKSTTKSAPQKKAPTLQARQGNMDSMTQQMMNDPDSMKLIENLRNDPAMQKILSDPELMKAVQEKDLGRIARDPNIQALEKNPSLQKLLQRNQ